MLGKASNELIDGFEVMKEAQAHTLSLIKPGVDCAEIAAAHDQFMRSRGLPIEARLCGHGQGYDMVERPLIRGDETMRLEAGMNLAVHPGYQSASQWAVICDNYLVETTGRERLSAQDREEDLRGLSLERAEHQEAGAAVTASAPAGLRIRSAIICMYSIRASTSRGRL